MLAINSIVSIMVLVIPFQYNLTWSIGCLSVIVLILSLAYSYHIFFLMLLFIYLIITFIMVLVVFILIFTHFLLFLPSLFLSYPVFLILSLPLAYSSHRFLLSHTPCICISYTSYILHIYDIN